MLQPGLQLVSVSLTPLQIKKKKNEWMNNLKVKNVTEGRERESEILKAIRPLNLWPTETQTYFCRCERPWLC